MSDGQEWTVNGRNILAPDQLEAIRHVLKDSGPVIVEHWFYCGSRSPDRHVFEDYDEFVEYLRANAKPGDALHVWEFSRACRDENTLAHGKYPDRQGRVPSGGVY